jgi:hypothetical protein
MSVGYKLPTNANGYYNSFGRTAMFFEGENYVEFLGQQHDKYSLSKFKSTRDPHFMYSQWYPQHSQNTYQCNPFTPHTMTRIYSEYFNELKFNFRYPFSADQTLFRNNITFNDGTEIVAGFAPNNRWYLAFHKYVNNKMEKWLGRNNYTNMSPLVKVSEDTFLSVENNAHRTDFQNGQKDTGSFGNILNTYGNSSTYPSDTLYLFDKDMTTIKSLTANGEIINIFGRDNSGNLIGLLMKYGANNNYRQILSVISITPDLIITELASAIVANETAYFYNNFYYQPAFSKDKASIYFLKQGTSNGGSNVNAIAPAKFEVDIALGSSSGAIDIAWEGTIPWKQYVYNTTNSSYQDKGIPVNSYIMTHLDYGSKKYLAISPVLTTNLLDYDTRGVSNGHSQYYYSLNQTKSYLNSYYVSHMSKTWLYEIDDTNNVLKFVAEQTHNATVDEPVKAVFPVNDKTLLIIKRTHMEIFSVDITNGAFVQHETINGPFHGIGIDSLERIWVMKNEADSQLEMISPGLSATVTVDFESNDLIYDSADLTNNVVIDARNYNGDRISTNLKLTLEGSAVFTENGLKSINVVTSLDASTLVPITIKGDGMINVFTSISG